jgi:hypothetical protein
MRFYRIERNIVNFIERCLTLLKNIALYGTNNPSTTTYAFRCHI